MFENIKSRFAKFKDGPFRRYQEKAIRFIQESTKPVMVIQAPTGFGKSLVGMCAGALSDDFTYLVSSKQLQAQLHDDFPEVEMIKGRNNYPCLRRPGYTADDCIDSSLCRCADKHRCPYEVQKKRCLQAYWRLLNYHYYLYESNYVGSFSGSSIVICDEGDLLEGLLTGFISLRIPGHTIGRLSIAPPPFRTAQAKQGVASWRDWAEKEAEYKICQRLMTIQQQVVGIDNAENPRLSELKKEEKRLQTLQERIRIFICNVDDTWLFEEKDGSYCFQPTWIPDELSEQYFFRHANRFVLMSATFPPANILGKLLGRPPGDFDYLEIPSSFPAENRQVWLNPVANLTHKTFEEESPKLLDGIFDIASRHLFEKGLIHAVSYRLTSYIMSMGIDRFITHNSSDREQVIHQFIESSRPLILVSPSVERGIDLPDDLCRFIIWAKAPFLYLGDKLTKKRVYSSKLGALWYRALCAQVIVQGCGRGVRHENDHCSMYVLDEQIHRLIIDSQFLFPRYFLDAIELN
nr:ATP-dependent helicase [Desulfobacterales bacterium]